MRELSTQVEAIGIDRTIREHDEETNTWQQNARIWAMRRMITGELKQFRILG